jgi:hypothetical protein
MILSIVMIESSCQEVHGGDEVGADPDLLVVLITAQEFGYPSYRFLLKAKLLLVDIEDCLFRPSMGSSLHRQATLVFDEDWSPYGIFAVEVAHVGGHFVSLNLLTIV